MGVHDGHRNRLRERFLTEGLDSFEAHNVLELILFYAIPRKDTNELAHRLLKEFGTFAAVMDAPIEALCKVKGISYTTAVLLKTYMPVSRYYIADKGNFNMLFDSPEACGSYFLKYFAGLTEERTVALCMDGRCKFLACLNLAEGDTCSVTLSSRKLLEAVLPTGATCVVLAHNHPSGVAVPSDSDVDSTVNLVDALDSVGINLADHIVVANDDYVSMAQSAKFAHIFKK